MGSRTGELERFREKIDRELKSGLVSVLLLLVIDRTGPAYGYEILKQLKRFSDGRLAFKEGTAYPLLRKLEEMELLTSFWGDGSGGPRRKYYQTTGLGSRALERVLEDWDALIESVEEIRDQVKEV